MKCKTRKPDDGVLISFSERRLRAILVVLESAIELDQVPPDEREAIIGVVSKIKGRLRKVW